nr:integrase, catalytic region, zinc finger, CCHC-type, peptidase aspartic, catalytic [Tanacetum cinerariifolium]
MSSGCNNIKLAIRNDKSEVVCAMCKQCLITVNHDVCVLNYLNGMNSCDDNQNINVSNSKYHKKHKPNVKKSTKLGSKERLTSPRTRKPKTYLRWSPTGRIFDHYRKIIKSSDSEWNILIARVYFVEGLGHNLFSVRQFCDSDLEVVFRRNTCFVRNLKGVDLLKGNCTTNFYTINVHEMASASPICLIARDTSTKSWLWHQRLSHLKFDTINELAKNDLVTGLSKFKYTKEHLCSSCEQGKSKKAPHKPKPIPNSKQRLHLLHMDLCRPMRVEIINENDREDIGKLGANGDIGFFIGYSANSCAYKVYNQRAKKIIETMNVILDELSTMAFEQRSLKPRLQVMTSRQISSGFELTYAPSTITSQKPTEHELELLFEAMYDDFIGVEESVQMPTNSSSHAPNIPNTSQDVDELPQLLVQQQDNQALLQPETIADNVHNEMFDGNIFENPFAPPSTSVVESLSSQYVDPSNMHTFYQSYQHDYQWTKDHPLEQVYDQF